MRIALARLRGWIAPRLRLLLPLFGGMAVCVLVWSALRYVAQPVPTRFRAAVRTQSLTFVLASWPDSAGLFNSETTPVELILLSPTIIHADGGGDGRCEPGSRLGKVKLLAIAMPENLRIALDVEAGGWLRYTLTAVPGTHTSLSLLVDQNSNRQGLALVSPPASLPAGEWHIEPSEPADPMEFSVRFAPASVPPNATPVPAPEQDIPLANTSGMLFRGESGLVGSGNQIRLLRTGRTLDVAEGLSLGGLKNASITRLNFDPAAQRLDVAVAGSADHIAVKVGEDHIPEADTRLSPLRPNSLGSTIEAVSAAIGGIASFVTLFRSFDKRKSVDKLGKTNQADGPP